MPPVDAEEQHEALSSVAAAVNIKKKETAVAKKNRVKLMLTDGI